MLSKPKQKAALKPTKKIQEKRERLYKKLEDVGKAEGYSMKVLDPLIVRFYPIKPVMPAL